MGIITALVILILLAFTYIGIYNGFIKTRNQVDESWAQIDVQLKRRCDLIPNLLETVKGYARHEQETLTKVIEARNRLMNADNTQQEKIAANNQLSGALHSIFALGESYPELKANTLFIELQHELSTTENKVAYSRQLYNSTVMVWNTKTETFPSNFIAGFHHFTRREMLKIEESVREVPKIQF